MIKFLKLQYEHLQVVLDWRSKPEVSRYMLTDIEQNIDKQRDWFNRISADSTVEYWIIEYAGKLIGVINLAEIDYAAKKCNAGFYIGETEYQQIASLVLPYFYNFVFGELKFNKIYGEVISSNKNILKIHMIQGYRHVGTYKDHLFKNGCYFDVHLVELMKEDWLKQGRYQSYKAEFELPL